MGSPVGKHTYKFFLGLGPKMLLVRDGKVNSLGNALSIICAFDEKGKILYSLLTCLDTEKNDSVYYGKSNVYDTYQKLTFE